MKINEIKDNKGARTVPKLLGRGIGSGLGKTCGRGGKGQTARTGVSINGFEGGQTPIYRRLPKRGFVNIHREELCEVSIVQLIRLSSFDSLNTDTRIDLEFLKNIRFARVRYKGVSVFGDGTLNTALSLVVDRISSHAKELILAAGGSVKIIGEN